MAHERKVPVSVLNIAMHEPHSVTAYVELMNGLYQMKQIVNIRSLTGLLIGSMHPISRDTPERGITGEIYQFTNLDPSDPWFDVNTLEEATEEETRSIKIPDNLKPHLARFTYIFFPHGHRMYVQTRNKSRSLSINSTRKFLRALLDDPSAPSVPKVEITVEPDRDSINKILKIKYLRKLHISLVRPNPDDLGDAERKLLERLAKQGADKMDTVLHANTNQKLTPDNDMITLARVAASNGSVIGSGRDEANNPVQKSTVDQPWVEVAHFDEDVQTEQEAILQLAESMHKKF